VINPELHKKPVPLDREKHRQLKLVKGIPSLPVAAKLNNVFLTAAEFADACKEYPIFFLNAGKDESGKDQVAPVAIFGVLKDENLFLLPDGRWDAYYIPATLRAYPFTMARVKEDQYVVCYDEAFQGFSQTEGEALFNDKGEPTDMLKELHTFVERLEVEVERTRRAGQRLMELNLLQPKRFDATLPDGTTLSVDGFLAADEERLSKLTDTEIVELERAGLLAMLHAHLISMGNMRRLVDRRLQSQPAASAPATTH
jgi:hypothetical protein